MKIYVFKFKSLVRIIAIAVIAVALLITVLAINPRVAEVFNGTREIPIYYVDTDEKKASLTFDCAWGADDIPQIIEVLKKENVKATFFIVGQWAEKFPDSVKLIASEGHDVANHSYSHLRMDALDSSRIRNEIDNCGKALSEISGKKIELFRPPYGSYNDSTLAIAKELGYYTIQWDVDSLDWKPDISKEDITSRVLQKIRNGSVILFHNDTQHTADLLPSIISSIKKQGYSLVPVSQLIIRDNYDIDYDGKQKRKE